MADQKSVDMDKPRTFFNPHPGRAGAAIPIPARVRKVAEDIDGKTISLKDAVKLLKAVGIGRVEVVPEHDYIALWLDGGEHLPTHMFQVIRYR